IRSSRYRKAILSTASLISFLFCVIGLLQKLPESDLRHLREMLLDAVSDAAAGNNQPLDRAPVLECLLGADLCRKLGIFRLPSGFKVSVVMPVYNEIRTLAKVIERLRATRLPLEIVIIDDGSHDGSREYLAELRERTAENGD